MIAPQVKSIKKDPNDAAVKIGLGADLLNPNIVFDLVQDAMNSPATSIPVIEQQTLDYAGIINDKDAIAAFPVEWKFFNHESNPGVDAVQTTFQHPGILQSAIIVKGVGFHVFAEPLCFTQQVNMWSVGGFAPEGTTAPPISPDVFSQNALASLGLGAGGALVPGNFSWGWPMQLAAWHMIEAYTFQWTVRQRYDLLKESARYVAHFGSFSDKVGAGTSEVPIMPFVQNVNRRLRTLGTPAGIALPIDHKRQGLWNVGVDPTVNTDTFIPSRAYQTAPVTWGGLSLQETYRNMPIHMIPVPYCIKSNSPLGLNLVATDQIHLNALIALMSAADQTGGPFPPAVVADVSVLPGFNAAGGPEVDLNATPAIFNSMTQVQNVDFKGGNLSIGMLVYGWEVTDDALDQICTNADIKNRLNSQFGLLIAG
jgi:hypothetical protein